MNSLSGQSISVYRLLSKASSMTAKEIASKLGVLPHAVYRTAKKLIEMGLIEKTNSWPVRFRTVSPAKAIDSYLLSQRNWFCNQFPMTARNIDDPLQNGIAISYIKDKETLYREFLNDQRRVKKDISLIVSGLEASAEVMLANKRAIERGVTIRILVQQISNVEMLRNWEKMGIQVRILKSLKTRILILDGRIVYLVSYEGTSPNKAVGVRIVYPPVAQLLQQTFEFYWSLAKR